MTNTQINEAIAKACGWKPDESGRGEWRLKDNKTKWEYDYIPNYIEDLNAMHEAEKILNPEQKIAYYHDVLNEVTGRFTRQSSDFDFLCASSKQRSISLCCTLGLWKE